LQSASPPATDSEAATVVLVNDNLRLSLTRLAGAEGYASLLRRSLSLTRAAIPVLQGAQVRADGLVDGLDEVSAHGEVIGREAAIAVTTQLLELLVIFLGEPLTRRVVREACSQVLPDK
jgi:hypothetical protein